MLIKPKDPEPSAEEALGIAMQKLTEQAAYVDKLEKKIEELENKLTLLKKEVFGVRLNTIGKTDPVDEYIKGE